MSRPDDYVPLTQMDRKYLLTVTLGCLALWAGIIWWAVR